MIRSSRKLFRAFTAFPLLATALLLVPACGHDKPPAGVVDSGGTTVIGTGGAGGQGGQSGVGGAGGAPAINISCDDLGPEPTVPPACATLMATKTVGTDGTPVDETVLDTAAIQAAIDACPAGQSVRLASDGDRVAFVSGAMRLRAKVALWIDAGTTLFASRNPRDFDLTPGSGLCGGNGTGNSSCNALINAAGMDGAAVVGTGTIDGRGGDVVADDTATWWELEETYDGQLAAPRLVQVVGGTNFTLYQVTLRNAPKFHVVLQGTVGFKVWGITINTPPTAPNTDGVDPSGTKNGVIAYSKITTGDDNVAIKGGAPVDGLIIAHNHFGSGHGMSIGSETNGGVKNVRVCDLSLDGTDNGLRIKSDPSRGGLVQAISYTDVCIRNVRRPLVFDPFYSSTTGMLIPNFRDIYVRNVRVLGGGMLTMRGRDAAHPLGLTLNNVVFDLPPTGTFADANITLGPGPVGVTPAGTNVTVNQLAPEPAEPRDCTDAFVTF